VKHYEIATYGTLHAFAKTLGENKAANLLAMTLDEKKKTDATLTGIAMSTINNQAHKADAITNIKA
jgi:ferritin-like metal-binding protein YciE